MDRQAQQDSISRVVHHIQHSLLVFHMDLRSCNHLFNSVRTMKLGITWKTETAEIDGTDASIKKV